MSCGHFNYFTRNKIKSVNKPNICLTKSNQVAKIDKELLEFCLIEVCKIQ